MNEGLFNNLGISPDLILFFALLSIAPFVIVSATSFVKMAVIFSLIRNALGVQQIPPNMVIYGMAAVLTLYVMLPVGYEIFAIIETQEAQGRTLIQSMPLALEPLSAFLQRNASTEQLDFFKENAKTFWPEDLAAPSQYKRFLSLLPAFLITELSEAFEIGFLIYLPFVVIDIVISNILLALGMMMVSPVTISLPFKLFLFVAVDGWDRLIKGLLTSYGTQITQGG